MPALDLRLVGDGAFDGEEIIFADDEASSIRIALLRGGMQSGKHSVAIGIRTPEGWVLGQTSFELLKAAMGAMSARVDKDVHDNLTNYNA